MSRKLLVSIHLYLAAFFAPFILVMALTGGLYLLGIKGEMVATPVSALPDVYLNGKSTDLKKDVIRLLDLAGIKNTSFDYVKVKGNTFYTRPTSSEHYRFMQNDDGIEISRVQPSVIASLIELHKGHGPTAYRWMEQLLALGLILIMLSGLYLGLMSPMLKSQTAGLAGAGLVVFILLAYVI